MKKTRNPVASGRFYPFKKDLLEEKIESCFNHRLGPGDVPVKNESKGFKAGMVPHAGYDFSGPCAAHVYKKLFESGIPEVVVVIGTLHTADFDGIFLDDRDYRTPLGETKNIFGELDKGKFKVRHDVFDREHSIEVQLPFLQHFKKDLEFLPVGVSGIDQEKIVESAEKLYKMVEGFETVFLASSDLSHCGPRYGDKPPKGVDIRDYMEEKDRKAIKHILERRPYELIETVEKEGITMCGAQSVALMLQTLKDFDLKSELLSYYSSNEILDGSDAVGYAGISFHL